MPTLKMSKDRKVANGTNRAGTQAIIPNTFGLPAGSQYSCGGMTEVCGEICYANNLERAFPSVKKNLLHNWELLQHASKAQAFALLDEMLDEFVTQSKKRDLPLIFRIHWDGDFHSQDYVDAWVDAIRHYGQVQFWVYTRQAFAAVALHKASLPNLALYFSTDRANVAVGTMLRKTYGIRLAYLADTFDDGAQVMRDITGKPGAMCPENARRIELINTEGSACSRCRLCVDGKADIRFSITKG